MNGFVSELLSPLAAGTGLGIFYFGGLWLTVKRLPRSQSPAWLVLASFLFRMAVIIPCFYLVMDGRMDRLVASVIGFFIVRVMSIRFAMPPGRTAPAS